MPSKPIRNILLTIEIVILAIVVCACSQAQTIDEPSLSISSHISASSSTITPETSCEIYGNPVLDMADNDISKHYMNTLLNYVEINHIDLEPATQPFKIFAAVPFEDGALLLAGTAISEAQPHLFYIVNSEVLAINQRAESWLFNYTSLNGHNIYFGQMEAGLNESTNSFDVPSCKAVAGFTNGKRVEYKCYPKADNVVDNIVGGGYILVADGKEWLTSLSFYDEQGNLNADMSTNSALKVNSVQSDIPWVKFFTSCHYAPFIGGDIDASHIIEANLGSEHPTAFKAIYGGNEFDIRYLWRNFDPAHSMPDTPVPPGAALDIVVYDWDRSVADGDSTHKDKGGALPPGSLNWFDISLDDGSEQDYATLSIQSDTAPEQPGIYCAYAKIDDWYYAQYIKVE